MKVVVYERVLESTVGILVPKGKSFVYKCGALVNRKHRLIITTDMGVELQQKVVAFFPAWDEEGKLTTSLDHFNKNIGRLGIQGRVVFDDRRRGLALIQLERLPEGNRALTVSSKPLLPGKEVAAISFGWAAGQIFRYSEGMVRAVFTQRWMYSSGVQVGPVRVVETSIPLSPGDSGCPLFNYLGELVGVMTISNLRGGFSRAIAGEAVIDTLKDWLSQTGRAR
jgi:S1-C subfamily serine protease